jgi:ABC-2 type transport system ATP-binding protein
MCAIITTHKLCKKYKSTNGPFAIKDVDIHIQQGEVFSLLGPNGAGKTTLLSILCGLFPPTSGTAFIDGHNVQEESLAVKEVVGIVPEEIALYPQLTGYQNLRYFGFLYGLRGNQLEKSILDVLTITGLIDRAKDKVTHYSSGMKRRLNLGAGILHNPKIILMDEPTIGLDPESRHRILDLILQLRQEKSVSILYTTHYIDEAEKLSDRVGILHKGKIIAMGTPEELIRASHAQDCIKLTLTPTIKRLNFLEAINQNFKGLIDIHSEGDAVYIYHSRVTEILPQILRLTEENGGKLQSLTVEKPNLEQVFLHLTGESLTKSA